MIRGNGIALVVIALIALPGNLAAHDVPDNVSIRVFFKPAGDRLQVLVRVPVKALLDVEFPEIPATGWLDLARVEPYAAAASKLWVSDFLTLYENDEPLPRPMVVQFLLSREADPSFNSFAGALAHVNGPALPRNSLIEWDRAALDVLLEAPIHSDQSDFSFMPRWGRLGIRVITTAGFLPPGGGIRTFEYEGDPARYRLNPAPGEAALHFLQLGVGHIVDQTDHLLFLCCVVLLFPAFRALLPFTIAFTLAHSFALSALGYNIGPQLLWIPPLVRTLMAASIIYMGIETVASGSAPIRRWIAAVVTGLVFGLGFWFDLQPVLQFSGAHPLIAVLSFNAGLEAGEVLALALLVAAIQIVFWLTKFARMDAIIFAGIVVHMAWHRMAERAAILRSLPVQWPVFDTDAASRWIFAIVSAAGFAWLVAAIVRSTLLGKLRRADSRAGYSKT